MSTFKNYTIIKSLGKGGMSEVFLAEDNRFKTQVAIKVLNQKFSANSNISQRFIAEARNLFRMSHPNIVRVTDLIEEDGKKAFVMEYIEGRNLRDESERLKNLSQEIIRAWLNQMLSAIAYCHSKGLIHREIKPSNFMITNEGQIKLLDFGISKNSNNNSEYTQTGTSQMLGTPMYMSPEQILETRSVDLRSDIYSLGVVLWQLVTGKKPYDSQTLSAFQIQTKIVNEPLTATGSKFDEIIKKCSAKDPSKRFQNCEEVQTAVNELDNFRDIGSTDDKTLLDINPSGDKTKVELAPKATSNLSKNKDLKSKSSSSSDLVYSLIAAKKPFPVFLVIIPIIFNIIVFLVFCSIL